MSTHDFDAAAATLLAAVTDSGRLVALLVWPFGLGSGLGSLCG